MFLQKKKLFIGVALVLVLVAAWFWGGSQLPEEELDFKTTKPAIELNEVTEQEESFAEQEKKENEITTEANTTVSTEDGKSTDIPVTEEKQKELTCTLSVRCDTILQNMDRLKAGKESVLPSDGIIYPEQVLAFSEGETVFDLLYRAMRKSGIHFEFQKTPMYDSVYIEGIGNLYEFDCGDYSGWMYRVNGESPNHGCSQHKLSDGDQIVFYYHCG